MFPASFLRLDLSGELPAGLEPATYALRMRRSTN